MCWAVWARGAALLPISMFPCSPGNTTQCHTARRLHQTTTDRLHRSPVTCQHSPGQLLSALCIIHSSWSGFYVYFWWLTLQAHFWSVAPWHRRALNASWLPPESIKLHTESLFSTPPPQQKKKKPGSFPVNWFMPSVAKKEIEESQFLPPLCIS